MRFVSIFAARGSRLAARGSSVVALTLLFGVLAERTASAQFMHESQFDAVPYDVDATPNGLIAVVRGNTSVVGTLGSDQRASFWRTDVTSSPLAKLTPNLVNAVGRGNLTTSNIIPGFPLATFSNAIAVNNERAVVVGSADSTSDAIEDTTYVDIVSFDYTQSPPTVTVLSTVTLGGGTNASTMAGLAHDGGCP